MTYNKCSITAFEEAFASWGSFADGEEVPTVNLGPIGTVHCRKCIYVNPYVLFSEGGRKWRCNICNLLNEDLVATRESRD